MRASVLSQTNRGRHGEKVRHEAKSSAVTFCSSHAMASSVIYYSTEAEKMEFFCFI